MRTAPEEVEDVLRSLKPRGLSRASRARVARRLAVRRAPWVAIATAACALAAVILFAPRETRVGLPPAHPVPAVARMHEPTLMAYRRAAAESEAALDALLARHAAELLPAVGEVPRLGPWPATIEGGNGNGA